MSPCRLVRGWYWCLDQVAGENAGMPVITAAPWSTSFVVGDDDGTAQVMSLGPPRVVATFKTVFSAHSHRIALVPGESPVVIAGAWARGGVCGYDAITGQQMWQRRDLGRVQAIRALDPALAGTWLEGQSARVLRSSTGREVARLRGVRQVLALSHDRCVLAGKRWAAVGSRDFVPARRVPLESFAVLDGALSPQSAAVSEADGPLRILGAHGDVVGRWAVPGAHVLRAAWDDEEQQWLGVIRHLRTPGHELIRLSPEAEPAHRLRIGDLADAAFLGSGRYLAILRHGHPARVEVVSTRTGAIEWEAEIAI